MEDIKKDLTSSAVKTATKSSDSSTVLPNKLTPIVSESSLTSLSLYKTISSDSPSPSAIDAPKAPKEESVFKNILKRLSILENNFSIFYENSNDGNLNNIHELFNKRLLPLQNEWEEIFESQIETQRLELQTIINATNMLRKRLEHIVYFLILTFDRFLGQIFLIIFFAALLHVSSTAFLLLIIMDLHGNQIAMA